MVCLCETTVHESGEEQNKITQSNYIVTYIHIHMDAYIILALFLAVYIHWHICMYGLSNEMHYDRN